MGRRGAREEKGWGGKAGVTPRPVWVGFEGGGRREEGECGAGSSPRWTRHLGSLGTDGSPSLHQRSTGELASYQKKLIRIDDHIGIAIAGLTSDARVLSYAPRLCAVPQE